MGVWEIVNAHRIFTLALLLMTCATRAANGPAFDATPSFDQANKLYEQGKFAGAVAAYESLVFSNAATPSLWFNLGNAAYKAGQMGRAIAAYRQAERVTPRDPALRANLQFVRGKIYSDDRTHLPFSKALLRFATLNEWTMLTAAGFWAFCGMLAFGEFTRRRFPKTSFVLLGFTALSGVALAAAVQDQRKDGEAIVIAREVTARFGPLDESQTAFQLRDGAEVTVLDTKGGWLQIRDPEKRTGWMHREDAIVLPGAFPARVR